MIIRRASTGARIKVILQPIGRVDKSVLEYLMHRIARVYDVELEMGKDIPLEAYNPERKQFAGSLLLQALRDPGTLL